MKGPDPVLRRARPASARRRSASRSRARWSASSCASRSAACATRPRSAATAAPTSARCPGRIVQALKQAGSMNPVFMLDEIDKMAAGYPGRPGRGAARGARPGAEPLVPRPLPRIAGGPVEGALHRHGEPARDRSIRRCSTGWRSSTLSGYSEEEKLHIARRYLLPRQMSEHGLPPEAMAITDAALQHGDRRIHARGRRPEPRAAARDDRAQGGGHASRPGRPTPRRPNRRWSTATRWTTTWARRGSRRRWRSGRPRPGVATGLAWTEAGGDVLFIEATLLPGGNQNIILTGQLGNVMQESARAALSHIRAQRRGLGDFAGISRQTRPARARAGGRDPEGRTVGRRHDGDGDPVGGAQHAGAAGRGDDRRDHAERAGAAGRRHPGEGAGGAAVRHQDGDSAGAQRARPGGAARGDSARHDVRAGGNPRAGDQGRTAARRTQAS